MEDITFAFETADTGGSKSPQLYGLTSVDATAVVCKMTQLYDLIVELCGYYTAV